MPRTLLKCSGCNAHVATFDADRAVEMAKPWMGKLPAASAVIVDVTARAIDVRCIGCTDKLSYQEKK